MASLANLENQQINGVLAIWYDGEFGKFRKSRDQQRYLVPIKIFENGEFGEFGKSTDQRSFGYMV